VLLLIVLVIVLVLVLVVVVRFSARTRKTPIACFLHSNKLHPSPTEDNGQRTTDDDEHEHEHDWGASSCRAYFRKRDTLRKSKYVRWIAFHFDYA
jgi:hypothetical protein